MVEDTCFPPQYTSEDKQGQLVNWGKFAVRYNPYLKLDSLDDQTVEVVLVRQSIHVAPQARLTLAFMDTRFPQVIELLKRSYKPPEHDTSPPRHLLKMFNRVSVASAAPFQNCRVGASLEVFDSAAICFKRCLCNISRSLVRGSNSVWLNFLR